MTRPSDHIHDATLQAMTQDLAAVQEDVGRPALRSALSEWTDGVGDGAAARPSRRAFLVGLAGGALILSGCGTKAARAATTSTTAGPILDGDLAVGAMAASLENLAVYLYTAAQDAVTAGTLGTVPPALIRFIRTAAAQHEQHAQAWNAALKAAGLPAVTATDPSLTPTINHSFARVTDAASLSSVALLIENITAQTYQSAISSLAAPNAVAMAAAIHPVEMQHAAILYYLLGQYPGVQGNAQNMFAKGDPLSFNPVALARRQSDYTGR